MKKYNANHKWVSCDRCSLECACSKFQALYICFLVCDLALVDYIHIRHGYFIKIVAILQLPNCQWSNAGPEFTEKMPFYGYRNHHYNPKWSDDSYFESYLEFGRSWRHYLADQFTVWSICWKLGVIWKRFALLRFRISYMYAENAMHWQLSLHFQVMQISIYLFFIGPEVYLIEAWNPCHWHGLNNMMTWISNCIYDLCGCNYLMSTAV